MRKILLILCLLLTGPALADEVQVAIDNFKQAPEVKRFFKNSYGYAVFPTVGKGGLGIGGSYGEGVVFKGHRRVGDTSLVQLSFGFQAGGQAFSEIVFFQDKRAYDKFTSGNFELAAQVSAVVITLGAQAKASTSGASAGTDNKNQHGTYVEGMAIFTYAKGGLMYEAAIGGQKFNFTPY
ncbi:lipid-binding SYLF domain-containing protein [Motilimonas cestriensis]|uniref:Lipid-binding SYLF domain-containing protein n=1 Tax=Motilimonas cestriensis TaxID=2742685 RepID=A0ABS8WG31_9GAMM|nr:lipid-binding SYLF domain-containing protein [Motilimonas cestriensis]MCE2596315.1 lipid-binding SYLF domain-containing protein [Motilimonas cestriensis]